MCFLILFTVVLFSSHLSLIGPVTSESVSFENGAYSNIVIAISPDVPSTWADTILENVQVKLKPVKLKI